MTEVTTQSRATIPDGMVLVPDGSFQMGDPYGYEEERPVHVVELSSFAMDRYAVTNAKYKEFCDVTGRSYPENPRWEEMPEYFLSYPEHPVVNVSQQDAADYARWAGKRLPTEVEWEYAARGGLKRAKYPWGDGEPASGRAQYAVRGSEYPWRDWRYDTGHRYTAPVGAFAPNGYGLYDMAGNVWEWCENWFYRYPWQEIDLTALHEGWGAQRVLRGGCFYSPAFDLRVSRRVRVFGGTGTNGSGFRCVLDVGDSAPAIAPKSSIRRKDEDEPWKGKLDEVRLHMRTGVELCLGVGPDLSEEDARRIRNLGFTSVEQYVTWETVENQAKGKFDFSLWDEQVRIINRQGLKWVPFLIAGPAYSLPDWYRRSDDFRGLVCLEHRLESGIQSIWDRRFRGHIERFVAAFAKRYRDQGVIESLLLGITGDFGEAIFPAWGGSWTFRIPGTYHSHGGFWCGDHYAVSDFRDSIVRRYHGDLSAVNSSWGTRYRHINEIDFPPLEPQGFEGFRVDEPTAPGEFLLLSDHDRRRWLDFVQWYRESMTNLARAWLGIVRKHFPDHPVYLCTGGSAPPYHGAHFGDQCRVAAEYGAGVRITNEASNYGHNFFNTQWVASAGRHYGAYFGFEPAGGIDGGGVTCRIYNAAVNGAANLHFYHGNVFTRQETVDAWLNSFDHIRMGEPDEPAALLYPDTSLVLGDVPVSDLVERVASLRKLLNFDFCDENMVSDGALQRYRLLIWAGGSHLTREAYSSIQRWVESGGLLVGFGTDSINIVDGEDVTDRLFDRSGAEKVIENGRSLWIRGLDQGSDARANVASPMTRWLASHGVHLISSQIDTVYAARLTDRIALLNSGDQAAEGVVTLPNGRERAIKMEANSILEVKLS